MFCISSKREYKFKLILLDTREFRLSYKGSQKCEQMLNDVAGMLKLEETEYFGFRYIDAELQSRWIDMKKSIHAQFKTLQKHTRLAMTHAAGCTNDDDDDGARYIVVYLSVRFYVTDPCKLKHELTRYLFYLQLRKDILQGRLSIPFDFAVDLFSYFLQAELGDHVSRRDAAGYASQFDFMLNQSVELEKAAEARHAKLKGMAQSVAEMNFLNKAKWLDMYGVELQPVLDEKNVEYLIGLTPTGIVVYQSRRLSTVSTGCVMGGGGAKVSSYFWPRISKLTYRGNKLMLRVLVDKRLSIGHHQHHNHHSHMDKNGVEAATADDNNNNNNGECTKSFLVSSEANCKALWRSCVEHHRFFRIKSVYEEPAKLNTSQVMSKHGRRDSDRHDPSSAHIKRVPAKRKQMRCSSSSSASTKANNNGSGGVHTAGNKLRNGAEKGGDLIYHEIPNSGAYMDVASASAGAPLPSSSIQKTITMTATSTTIMTAASMSPSRSMQSLTAAAKPTSKSRRNSRGSSSGRHNNNNNNKNSNSDDEPSPPPDEDDGADRSLRRNSRSNKSSKSMRHHHQHHQQNPPLPPPPPPLPLQAVSRAHSHHHQRHRSSETLNRDSLPAADSSATATAVASSKSRKSLNEQMLTRSNSNHMHNAYQHQQIQPRHQREIAAAASTGQSETCHETTNDEADSDEMDMMRAKRQVRRRKRSKSPANHVVTATSSSASALAASSASSSSHKPPDELLQHIKYDLVVPESGMSADQLREIPFVKVETAAPPYRISPHQRQRRFSPHQPVHRRRSGGNEKQTSSTNAATSSSAFHLDGGAGDETPPVSVVAHMRDPGGAAVSNIAVTRTNKSKSAVVVAAPSQSQSQSAHPPSPSPQTLGYPIIANNATSATTTTTVALQKSGIDASTLSNAVVSADSGCEDMAKN